MRSLFFMMTAVAAWGESPAAGGNPLDIIINPVKAILESAQGAGMDIVGYFLGLPAFAGGIVVWAIEFVRGLPALFMAVWNGDKGTQDKLAGFCVDCATMCLVTYTTVAALNLTLLVLYKVKTYFKDYLKIPAPLAAVLEPVQKHVLDKIIGWKATYVMPLSGEKGEPSVSSLATNTAAAISLSILLACTPGVLALCRGGANKADAEALLWTVGTALGIQWGVGKVF